MLVHGAEPRGLALALRSRSCAYAEPRSSAHAASAATQGPSHKTLQAPTWRPASWAEPLASPREDLTDCQVRDKTPVLRERGRVATRLDCKGASSGWQQCCNVWQSCPLDLL